MNTFTRHSEGIVLEPRKYAALLASDATDALRGLELGDRTLDGADASLILLRLMAKGFRITRA